MPNNMNRVMKEETGCQKAQEKIVIKDTVS